MVNRRVATSMLKKYGAIVSSVNGGGEAVVAVKNQREDEKLDLVLMDIQMPEVKFTNLKVLLAAHFRLTLILRMLLKPMFFCQLENYFCFTNVMIIIDGWLGSNAPNT